MRDLRLVQLTCCIFASLAFAACDGTSALIGGLDHEAEVPTATELLEDPLAALEDEGSQDPTALDEEQLLEAEAFPPIEEAPESDDAGELAGGEVSAQATALKPRGQSYIWDGFDDTARSKRIWYDASCTTEGYVASDYGTTSRKGYCRVIKDPRNATNQVKRFITRPFDTRAASVDWRKGGSEMRPLLRWGTATTNRTYYGHLTSGSGWDPAGEFYLTKGNRVRYSWDFRVENDSILEHKFATSAVLGQFHGGGQTRTRSGAVRDCGGYNPSLSPSPGLLYKTYRRADTGRKVSHFTLFVKITPAQAAAARFPVPAGACKPGATYCTVHLWEKEVDYTKVKGKWLSLSYIFTLSPTTGKLEFFFGDRFDAKSPIAYQRQPLSSARTGSVVMGTMENQCPSNIFLGQYVLGYNSRLYGTEAQRDQYGPDYVTPAFLEAMKPFANAVPQLVVDYDNFRIIQE